MKTLERLFSSLAAVLLLAMAAPVLVSCGDDDNPTEEKRVATYANGMFTYEVAQEVLDLVDVMVKYTDGDEVKTEKMTTTTWIKSTKQAKIPATVGLKVTMKLKDGVTLDKDEYTVSEFTGEQFIGIFDQNGSALNANQEIHWSSMDTYVSKEEFVKYVNEYSYEYVVNVKEGGKIEQTTKDW